MGSLDDFAKRMSRIAVAVEAKAERAVKDVSREVARAAIEATPVDTGLARSNWQTGLDAAPIGVLPARICLIDDPDLFDFRMLKRKSVSLHWELMFTRSLFETPDMASQHDLLAENARKVDEGTIRTTLAEHTGTINAENLRRAHSLIETGKSRGKIVREGF
jgi:NADPH:quinone reductase-like Zn-dependent oxidoreductase